MTLLGIVLAGLVLSLLAASTAGAARSEFFGIAQGMKRLEAADIQGMQDARVRTERFLLQWSSRQPSQGSLYWTATDAFVGALASHGIRPVPFVWGSPRWVSDNYARPPLDSAAEEQAWQDFLRAAVARYGTNGSYWTDDYPQQYPGATPLPIQAWQIWNEPNLAKYFQPSPSPARYARLLQLSHDAIKSQDPEALVVLAGLVGSAQTKASTFLNDLYGQPGDIRDDFDIAALHPYGSDRTREINAIQQFRGVMTQHSDGATPLWLTEVGWGSDPPDQFGINKGLDGQERLLRLTYGDILSNREAWNVQRLFWFYWRDPAAHLPGTCSFCSSAGLLRYNFTAKPAYDTFLRFTAETDPPQASITSGPSPGGFTNDSTPGFTFASDEPGSTFACRFDAQAFSPCSSPLTPASPLSDGAHTFYVKAIDAPGNESVVRSRSFHVDTSVPVVTISSGPADGSTSSNPSPTFDFASNEPAASLSCQLDGGGFEGCSSPFTASGLADGSHTFQVRATDAAQNNDVASRTWTVDTNVPEVTISSGPADGSTSPDRSPSFGFVSDEPDVSLSCQLDGGGFEGCSSPFTASRLADGSHTFQVKATDAAQNTDVASRAWTVDGAAEVSITAGPASGSVIRDPTPSFAFSSLDSDSNLSCRIDDAAFASCTSPFATSALADGLHTFRVKATDTAQRTDADSRWFIVDTTDPTLKIEGPSKTMTRNRRAAVTFKLKASEQVDRRCRIDSRRFKPCSSRYRTPKLWRGTHTLKVKATDRAGNVGTKSKRFKIVGSFVGRSS